MIVVGVGSAVFAFIYLMWLITLKTGWNNTSTPFVCLSKSGRVPVLLRFPTLFLGIFANVPLAHSAATPSRDDVDRRTHSHLHV